MSNHGPGQAPAALPDGGSGEAALAKLQRRTVTSILGEIERLEARQNPTVKTRSRAAALREWLLAACGTDPETAVDQLQQQRRKNIAKSIHDMLARAALREHRAAQKRARDELRQARNQARERKLDARQKIIIGGTIIAAIRDAVPAAPAILELLQTRLASSPDWRFVQPVFTPSADDVFLKSFNLDGPADLADRTALLEAYKNIQNKLDRLLEMMQSQDNLGQKKQRAADARRKIMIGGAILAAIRGNDPATPALRALLDDRIASQRDRETIRALLPLAEFRPSLGR